MEIIILIILAVLGVALVSGVSRLAGAVSDGAYWLRGLFHLAKDIDVEKAESPRSLSSVTELALPDIMRDFPEYNLKLILPIVKRDAAAYLRSFERGRCMLEGVSPELAEQVEDEVSRGLYRIAGGVRVHSAVIHDYKSAERDKVIEYQAAAEYMDAERKRRQLRLELSYIAMFTTDVEHQSAAFTCPQCGAPVSQVGAKVCEYCGTALNLSANLSWTLFKIE